MSLRAAIWLAWALVGLSLAMFIANIVLYVLARSVQVPGTGGAVVNGLVFVPFLAFPIVGALIASRRPENPIGWICLADGFLWMFLNMADLYITYAFARPGSVPFPVTSYALTAWLWVPAVGLLGVYLVLLFPDGRLPSRRWRPLAWLSGAVMVLVSVVITLFPGPLGGHSGARNPFGIEGQPWIEYTVIVLFPLLPLCILASAFSLVLRYQRSSEEERQQIKWIAFAASAFSLLYLILVVSSLFFPSEASFAGSSPFWSNLLRYAALLSFAGVPVAVGFAVLKYHLYDIDVIINRAFVYGILTATLALVYLGGVVSLQYLFRFLTGEDSQLAIVASTLAIAALFNPLRRRIQDFVDRRFYRKKYDAARVLKAFSARLRDETDLDRLNGDLVAVVRETVQPAHASMWLRDPVSYEGRRRDA